MKLRRFTDPDSGLVHHYSQVDPLMEARLEGYSLAARQHREGKRIAKPLDFWGRVGLMVVCFVSFAAVALTSVWVLR